MSRKALIVVDMLRDFLEEDGALYCGEKARAIIPFVSETLENMRKEGAVIIFVRDAHKEDDVEFKRFPKHCVEGTRGAEIIDSLKVEAGDYVIPKRHFSAFYETNLEEILKNEGVDELYLVGVCTSICIMETTRDLIDRDYKVYILRQGVADFDDEAHTFALKRMERVLGAGII